MEQHISVTDPIGLAIERVRQVLFRPFDLGKWFVIGFCAWLASLGEPGFHGGFNFVSRGGRQGRQGLGTWLDQAKDFIVSNLYWIVPLAVTAVVIILALWVLFSWLSSRGRFMF